MIGPWGKLYFAEGRLVAEQSLVGHCRDVAAVVVALLEVPVIAARLARLARRDRLEPATVARLGWVAHLHDAGKTNAGFQRRRDPAAPMVGHVAPLAALFGKNTRPPLDEAAAGALALERLIDWGEQAAVALFEASLSHHGRPWPYDRADRSDECHWRRDGAYDPLTALADLGRDADAMFPQAFAEGPTLPDSPAFVHAFAGLVQIADWLASADWQTPKTDESRAAWARDLVAAVGLDGRGLRAAIATRSRAFVDLFGFPPRPAQAAVASAEGSLIILESETGSGKTEAALARFADLFARGAVDGLFFAVPTRTAAVQLHARVRRFAAASWGDAVPEVVLAVPGYLDETTAGALPGAVDPIDGADGEARRWSGWASEHPKRYFAGTLAVGTIDQALLAGLRVKHAHLRGAALMRHLLVVDEVHASDAYMRRILEPLLRDHVGAGGHAVLLSATLGGEARRDLVAAVVGRSPSLPSLAEAVATAYPLITAVAENGCRSVPIEADGRTKDVAVCCRDLLDDPRGIAELALAEAGRGAKVLVVRNTVAGAVAVQRELEVRAETGSDLLFRVGGIATLHHGRFAREDRRLLDAAVEAALGRDRPPGGLVVVGTQTLEQSLDIDADLLITDLCPIDVLLQRLGRLHRHVGGPDGEPRRRAAGFETPRAVVSTPAGGLGAFLADRRPNGLPRHGLGSSGGRPAAYPDLAIVEATRRLIVDEPIWSIPAMNRRLVESALHSEAIEALIEAMPSDQREAWRGDRSTAIGTAFADRTTAALGVLRRDLPLMDPKNAFGDDERIGTRLGGDGWEVELPACTIGPFGEAIRRLTIPDWMIRGSDPTQPSTEADDGRLVLVVGGAPTWTYDRHGLSFFR